MAEKKNYTEEELEILREKAIQSAIDKFGWTREECEECLGKNYVEFMRRVNLVDKEE